MFIPFLSDPSVERRKLWRRKGGGGGGRGGGGGGSSSKGGGSSSGSVSSGRSTTGSSISTSGTSKSTRSYGLGGGSPITIPAGQMFAGRLAGGGTRSQVYGNSQYGSGYPGTAARGVAGRGFPFFFWPVAFGGAAGFGAGTYIHNTEYGRPDNSSRPGGRLMAAVFTSSSQNTTCRLLSDNATVVALIQSITESGGCSTFISSPSSITPLPFNSSDTDFPKPEQVIQYYRASSVALSLDGYNNTAIVAEEGTPDVPLPTGIDLTLVNCLNNTIGASVPLVDGAVSLHSPSSLGILGLAWLIWLLTNTF